MKSEAKERSLEFKKRSKLALKKLKIIGFKVWLKNEITKKAIEAKFTLVNTINKVIFSSYKTLKSGKNFYTLEFLML